MTKTVIACAHPAETFGEDTARMLESISGCEVVCVNPHDDPRSLERMIEGIEIERKRRGLERWIFWGMSGGGWLAQLYARRHPEVLSAVIIESCCANFRRRLTDPSCVLSPFFPAWREGLASAGLFSPGSHDHPREVETEWIELAGIGSVFREVGGPALLVSPAPISQAMKVAMPSFWRFDSRAWLPTLAVRALVIAGTQDPIVPLASAREVHELIPGSSFVAVEGGGHVPTQEQREEARAAVRRFLGGVSR